MLDRVTTDAGGQQLRRAGVDRSDRLGFLVVLLGGVVDPVVHYAATALRGRAEQIAADWLAGLPVGSCVAPDEQISLGWV